MTGGNINVLATGFCADANLDFGAAGADYAEVHGLGGLLGLAIVSDCAPRPTLNDGRV